MFFATLLAIAVYSAPLSEHPHEVVDAIVPEMDGSPKLVLTQEVAKSTTVSTSLGMADNACTYDFQIDNSDEVENDKDKKPIGKKHHMHLDYSVTVTPDHKLPKEGVINYKVQGATMSVKAKGKTEDLTKAFKKCHIKAVQHTATGMIKHVLDPQDKNCDKKFINMLIGTLQSLSVPYHAATEEFTQVEGSDVFHTQQRRVNYSTKKLTNGETLVQMEGRTLIQNRATLSGDHMEGMMSDEHKGKTTVLKAGHIGKSREERVLKVGDQGTPATPIEPSTQKLALVPKGLNDSKEDSRSKDTTQRARATVEAELNQCSKELAAVQVSTDSLDEHLEHQKQSGYAVLTSFFEDPDDLPHGFKGVANLSADKLPAAVTELALKLTKLPGSVEAYNHADSMMQLRPIRKEVLRQIHEGTLFGNNVAHELLNAYGTMLIDAKPKQLHEIVGDLVQVAADKSLPVNTREQAVYSLMNDQCHDQRPAISAIESELLQQGADSELEEFALQIQHGLMRAQKTCDPSTDFAQFSAHAERTEALLAEAVSAGKYQQARAMLTAMANSKFERHAKAVKDMLDSNQDLPPHMRYGAVETLAELDGEDHRATIGLYTHDDDEWTRKAARKGWTGEYLDSKDSRASTWSKQPYPTKHEVMLTQGNNKGKKKDKKFCTPSMFSYNKEWPLPDDGDFQVIGALTTGVDSSGAKGVATATVKVYKYKKTIVTLTAEKQGFGLCEEGKPASLVLKIFKNKVYKREFPKDKKTKKGKENAAGKSEKKKPGKTFKSLKNPLDIEGFCMTQLGKKTKCLMGEKMWKKTFFKYKQKIMMGPIPCSLSVALIGKWGLQYGIGMLGDCTKNKGKKKKMEIDFLQKKGAKGKGKCKTDDGTDFNGFLVMLNPFAKADLTIKAAVDAYVVKAGVAANINLLTLGLPVTLDSCIWGDCTNQCINTQISTKAGGGRVYAFISIDVVIYSDEFEFDIFNWAGAEWVWPKPKDDEYTGKCTGYVPSPPSPPPPPALEDTDCIVDIYSDKKYKGTLLQRCNTNNKDGKFCVIDSSKVENQASSYKMYGKCGKFEVYDEDGCKEGDEDNKTYEESAPEVPDDLDNDICGIKVWGKE
jgi:hypothetical protein